MPQRPDWNKFLDAGAEFVALTRGQARARAKDLVAQGHLAQGQVQGFVDDLVDESRRRSDLLMDVVRQEIQRQVTTLGIATKDDLVRLEAKLARSNAPAKAPAKMKAPAKPAAKKALAKPAAKKAPAKRAAAKTTAARPTKAS